MKYIHCHESETKLLLIANTILEKLRSQSSFTLRSMEDVVMLTLGFAFIALNAPIRDAPLDFQGGGRKFG